MYQKKMLKQMIDFNKTAFDNNFNAIVKIQDQFDSMTTKAMDQINFLPAEFSKGMEQYATAFKNGRDNFKKFVDDGYKKVEEYLTV